MNIPNKAVEAAAIAMEEAALVLIGRDLGFLHRNDIARAALEAAAPYIIAGHFRETNLKAVAHEIENPLQLRKDAP